MIKEISFEDVKPFWNLLWSNLRLDERSGRQLLDGFDENIITNDQIKVTYLGFETDGKIVGVNSGFSPKLWVYRSRGLFVHPNYRKRGISQELLQATENQGKLEGAKMIWSMPRRPALPAYKKFGFKVVSEFKKGMFGENCYAMKVIK